MKIENVLEIEYMPVFDDKFIVRIKSQNCNILKRGEFEDTEICVQSVRSPEFTQVEAGTNMLFIRGRYKNDDNKYEIVSRDVLNEIIRRVELVNKKYGIKVKERVAIMGRYYYINRYGDVQITCECATDQDDTLYKAGNYFSTRQEAEDSLIYKAFQKTKEDLRINESRSKKIC